jgi:hypothetical protein
VGATVTGSLGLDGGYRYHRVEEVGSDQHAIDYVTYGDTAGVSYGF